MDEIVKRTIEAAIRALDAENARRTFEDKSADFKAGYNTAVNALKSFIKLPDIAVEDNDDDDGPD